MSQPSISELKNTYEKLVFVHQALTQKNQYFIEEFEVAKSAIQMITEMANKIGQDIHAIEQAAQAQKEAEEKAQAEQAKAEADAKAKAEFEATAVKTKKNKKARKPKLVAVNE